MIKIINDRTYHYKTIFNTKNGHYVRMSNELFAEYPHLIDLGIMGSCDHGKSGLCLKAGVKCYQNGNHKHEPNMKLEDFKRIIDESRNRLCQVALGGRGDPDMHENFEEIVRYSAQNFVVPNFTTSGLGLTQEKVDICKKYCGAVAVSMYSRLSSLSPILVSRNIDTVGAGKTDINEEKIPACFTFGGYNPNCKKVNGRYEIDGQVYDICSESEPGSYSQQREYRRVFEETREQKNYTFRALNMLIKSGVMTNIHYVLSNTTIDEAILRLKYNGFPRGINAVIFLLHKPVGLGDMEDVLSVEDPRLAEFFRLVDEKHPFKIGFDSCTIPGVINFCKNINPVSLDSCEGARFSMYITADMIALPCSFDNVNQKYGYSIKNKTVEDAWNSKPFNEFRSKLKTNCTGCSKRISCLGGCPLEPSIILCNNKEVK